MNATFKIEGILETQARLASTTDYIERRSILAIMGSAFAIQGRARQNVGALGAVDTGQLRREIYVRLLDGGLAAEVGVNSDYGVFVEEGTGIPAGHGQAKAPPVKALQAWADRHGIPVFLVWRSVAQKIYIDGGQKPRPYLKPAWKTEAGRLRTKLANIVKAAAKGGH